MAYSSNHSYSGGKDWEDHGLRPAKAKSYGDPPLNNQGVVYDPVIPAIWEAIKVARCWLWGHPWTKTWGPIHKSNKVLEVWLKW
jgi:hypothetical protein